MAAHLSRKIVLSAFLAVVVIGCQRSEPRPNAAGADGGFGVGGGPASDGQRGPEASAGGRDDAAHAERGNELARRRAEFATAVREREDRVHADLAEIAQRIAVKAEPEKAVLNEELARVHAEHADFMKKNAELATVDDAAYEKARRDVEARLDQLEEDVAAIRRKL